MGSSPIVIYGSGSYSTRTRPKNKNDVCVSSSGFVFFIVSFVALGLISGIYVKFIMTPNVHIGVSSVGCKEDDEGSWSIGVFYGDSPFSLKPIEDKRAERWIKALAICEVLGRVGSQGSMPSYHAFLQEVNIWRDKSAAWPIANPVITCASASEGGFPSNFVADPFLYIQGDVFYLFFETKNSITVQGDIGVARSTDKGASWEQLGIALDEDWHMSYPYVFEYNGNIYMLPESRTKGQLRLYRAVNFPLKWTLEKIIMKKPLVDSFIIPHDGKYWLFGSDHSGIGAEYNAQLEIWYSGSPLGPWKPHMKNPIYNMDKTVGARNGGRPFLFDGYLYRVGQDDGETYGRRIRLFRIEVLTTDNFKEVEVPLGFKESIKGRNAWNGARSHHLDVQRLSSGEWVGVMDGDHVPSGDASLRFHLGCAAVLGVAALVIMFGVLVGAVNGLVPLSWCPHNVGKRSDASLDWEQSSLFVSRIRLFCSHLNRESSSLRARIKPNTCSGSLVLTLIFLVSVVLMCTGVKYIYGGSGAHEAYSLHGQYSQFTLLTMTYDARIWNLKIYVKHYSRCSSVREIVVVWNKGQPPDLSEFDSAVPVRIRVEEKNSLNNRFKVDPSIKTRAVLELDDDIMMPCDDVERGFKVWREHPERIVGFYPRLANGSPLRYRAEKHARKNHGYNMILTGAAFMDRKMAFEMYWSKEAAAGREVVDNLFNCEDVLLNYLYANTSSSNTVEYVKPAWAIDTSKFTGVAISQNTQIHYALRSKCLQKFSEMYGSITNRKSEFNYRMDGWDV